MNNDDAHFNQNVITPAEVFEAIRRRKWLVLLLVLLGTGAATIYTLRQPKIYSSSAKVLLIWLSGGIPNLAANEPLSNAGLIGRNMASEIEIMMGAKVRKRVVELEAQWQQYREGEDESDKLQERTFWEELIGINHPDTPLPPIGAWIVFSTPGNILRVQYDDSDPSRAARIVNYVVKAYLEIRAHFFKVSDAMTFLEEQIEDHREILGSIRSELEELSGQERIYELQTQKQNLLGKYLVLESELLVHERKRLKKNEEIDKVKRLRQDFKIDGGIPKVIKRSDVSKAGQLISELTSLELARAKLLIKFTEEHPELVANAQSIALVKKLLLEEMGKVFEREIELIEEELDEIIKDEALARSDYVRAEQELKTIPDIESRFHDLNRDLANYESTYQTLLKNQEQERLKEARNQSEVTARLISPATFPRFPIKPNVVMNIIAGFVTSLVLGMALAFMLEYLDKSVKTVEQVEKLAGLPVLARTPQLSEAYLHESAAMKFRLPASGSGSS